MKSARNRSGPLALVDGLARVRLVELAEHRAALAPLHEHEFLRRVPFLPLDQPAAGASSGSPLIGRHRLSPAGGLAAFVEWREETAVRKGRGGPRPINPETPLEGSSPADLAWLAGTWRARIGENEIEERWSEFGEGTLMAMFRASDVFRMGVAGAPVTHWDGYDTHYTERYMGLPSENAAGYEASSVLPWVSGLEGKLMVVHGMIDENVHFRHTGRLVNALTAARKDFDLRVFPDERHMPRKPADRLYMEEQIVRFLVENL